MDEYPAAGDPRVGAEMRAAALQTDVEAARAALRRSEERYRRLLASITDYAYEVQVEAGRVVSTVHGPGCVAVTGFSPEEYATSPLLWHRMVHEEDRAAVEEQARRVLSGETTQALEHRIVHKDGSLRWLRNTPVPRLDAEGRLVGYDALVSDITERRHAEEALRESEEKYRTLFLAATDAIFVESVDGKVLECNTRACDMFRCEESELTTLTVADLVPPEIAATLPAVIERHLATGGIHIEALNQRRDGEVFPCEVSTRLTTIGGEQRVIAYVRDITERKEAEAARIREREAEARAAAAEASKAELEREVARRRDAEQALKHRTNELGEKVKELHCLFEISRCLELQDEPLESMLAEVVAIIPLAFRFPAATCARIELGRLAYATPSWRLTPWTTACPINALGTSMGTVSAGYIESWDGPADGPFLPEERRLLEAVASRVGAVANRKRAEDALRESEEKFRTLADQSPNMILINQAGRIVYANEVCERTLGYPRDQLYSADFSPLSLFAPEFLELGQDNFTRHMRGEEVAPCEYTLLASDGRHLEVIFATKLIDLQGAPAILGIVTDITQRKREEEKLRELQRQITDLPAKEQRRIGQELHDNLGQQLTGVAMLLKSLCQKLTIREVPEAEDAEQIFGLVQEAHAQTRALSRGLIPVEVDAKGLMRALELAAESRDRLPGPSCRFVCREPVAVEDNNVATQLYRIAQEAISNAILHGRPDNVEVRLHCDRQHTTLEIVDDGVGIADNAVLSGGTGIEIMRYRASAIGAELTIHSPEGGGTVVTCTLRR